MYEERKCFFPFFCMDKYVLCLCECQKNWISPLVIKNKHNLIIVDENSKGR